jgi:hypothetical protein
MNIPTVIVYSPSGEPERHTRPNARDLVNGAGYTWMKGVPTTPASIAPFVAFDPPDEGHPSQKVLDSRGSSASAANGAASGAAIAQAAETGAHQAGPGRPAGRRRARHPDPRGRGEGLQRRPAGGRLRPG